MNEPSKINPYESPDMFSGAERQGVELTIQQKADAIKSTKRRLKENESKVDIYNDYKNTNIEKTLRKI